MSAAQLFYLFIIIIIIDFFLEQFLDYLNAKRFDSPIPKSLEDVYDTVDYKKSQAYKKL